MNFDEFKELTKEPCLVVLGAPWCPDCRRIEPILHILGREYDGQINIHEINVDEQTELKDLLAVRRIPTIIAYRDGEEFGERLIEPNSKDLIENLIKQIL